MLSTREHTAAHSCRRSIPILRTAFWNHCTRGLFFALHRNIHDVKGIKNRLEADVSRADSLLQGLDQQAIKFQATPRSMTEFDKQACTPVGFLC